MIPETEIQSADDVKATETDRNAEQYAEILGLKIKDLQRLLENRTVMDLGAGPGVFAANMEAWKLMGAAAPERVDSLNLRYAATDYAEFEAEAFSGGKMPLVKPPGFIRNVSRSIEQAAWNSANRLLSMF